VVDIPFNDIILRFCISLLLGAVIGIEREFSQQSAGLRTHMLVCLGATVFTMISVLDLIPVDARHALTENYRIVRDPARIMAQIVTGIGFIGGGAVLRHGVTVKGLTTAASLWMMASVGMLVGVGMIPQAIWATGLSFLTLFVVGNIEQAWLGKGLKTYNRVILTITVQPQSQQLLETWIESAFGKDMIEITSQSHSKTKAVQLRYVLDARRTKLKISDLSRRVNQQEGVLETNIQMYQEPDN
jgi:putative Mg2+ transporter-C (MgtC) family protein